MTGWERWFTGNCASDWNFTFLTNGELHKPESVLENKNLSSTAFYCSSWPQSENERKRKNTLILPESWKKTMEYESDGGTNQK